MILPPTDCNGITGGALVDSCGTCQQAYIYNFSNDNTLTFVDNANILIAGVDYNPSIEAFDLPTGNPNNPLWINDPYLCSNTI